jgi:hypothetical protein|tara:strand:- start:1469 stop:1663 length:195 start_codon:yes stop_codon:yes gene_type:complete
MGIKRHKPEEIVRKLRQIEVLVGQEMARIIAFKTAIGMSLASMVGMEIAMTITDWTLSGGTLLT